MSKEKQQNNEEIMKTHQELVSTLKELLGEHETFKEALQMDEQKIMALALYARDLADKGQMDEAQTILEGLVVLDPQNPYLHTVLGTLYFHKDLKDAAKVELLYALKLDPEDTAALAYLGEIYLHEGNLEEALKMFEKAVSLDPEGKDPFANRARALSAIVATLAKEVEEKGEDALKDIEERMKMLEELGLEETSEPKGEA